MAKLYGVLFRGPTTGVGCQVFTRVDLRDYQRDICRTMLAEDQHYFNPNWNLSGEPLLPRFLQIFGKGPHALVYSYETLEEALKSSSFGVCIPVWTRCFEGLSERQTIGSVYVIQDSDFIETWKVEGYFDSYAR